ncbi:MAG TPA: hypothetical protein DEQ38_10515 [Elusimicrobia bacterium]|nr:MAG: hypothetical protein A2089_07795 [Elusimicrobia bacterium GWD2_63_28]HCC48529.1 hypothetical protein [Elusimicrobiota bacterium]
MFCKYIIKFEDGQETVIDIELDPSTMTVQPKKNEEPPQWALLDTCKCRMCPLDSATSKYCPIALNLAEVTRTFSDKASTMIVETRVVTQEREYFKKTSLQSALSSLIGIYMVTSGCPVMSILTPMARFHLPFATLTETVYRSISSYLLRQYLRKKKGLEPDWELKKLNEAYKSIEILNAAITDRVRSASSKDANYNAVIILDAFAKMVPWNIDRGLTSKELMLPAQDEKP